MVSKNLNKATLKQIGLTRGGPKEKKVDYVNIAGLRDLGKRNQPCPCGSGVKYKNCCRGKSQGAR